MNKNKLKISELNEKFIDALGDHITFFDYSQIRPMIVNVNSLSPLRLRVYMYNCTQPDSMKNRPYDEYKIQLRLTGQKAGKKAKLDFSDDRMPIICGYLEYDNEELFVLFDAYSHAEFSPSVNVQVKEKALIEAVVEGTSKYTKTKGEKVIVARKDYLFDALRERRIF